MCEKSHFFQVMTTLTAFALSSLFDFQTFHHAKDHRNIDHNPLFGRSVYWVFNVIKAGVPNLQNLMPNDLRWSWCNNKRNKCNTLESSQNHPFHPSPWKNCFPRIPFLVPKSLGTDAVRIYLRPHTLSDRTRAGTQDLGSKSYILFPLHCVS